MISKKLASIMCAVSTVLFQEVIRHEYSSEEAIEYWTRDNLPARGTYFVLDGYKFCLFTKRIDEVWFLGLELCDYGDDDGGVVSDYNECFGYYRIHPETTCWDFAKIVGAVDAMIDQYCPGLAGI